MRNAPVRNVNGYGIQNPGRQNYPLVTTVNFKTTRARPTVGVRDVVVHLNAIPAPFRTVLRSVPNRG